MGSLQIEQDSEWNPYKAYEAEINSLKAENAEIKEQLEAAMVALERIGRQVDSLYYANMKMHHVGAM